MKQRVKEGYESAQKKGEVNKWRTKKEIKVIKNGASKKGMVIKRREQGAKRRKRHRCVIHERKFNRAWTTRDDLLNHTAATSNLNYCDKHSPG